MSGVGWHGCRCSQRWGRSAERFPTAPPGLTHALMARASSRPSQAGGRRGGEGADAVPAPGSGTRGGDPPITRRPRRAEKAAPTRRPRPSRLPGVSCCLLQPARRAPAPTPEGRYLGASAPRSLPAAVGASLRITHPTSASAEGEGKGRGERRNRPFLRRPPPAGIATGGARAHRSAAQRPGGAGALAARLPTAAWAPPLPPFPASTLQQTPAGATPPRVTGGRWVALTSPCLGRVGDSGSEFLSLYSPGSLLDPHLLGYPPLGSAAQSDPAPALRQVFHVAIAFASQCPGGQVGATAYTPGFPLCCA